ncbi:MAG: hypothetical protein FJ279_11930 [Planctomycetes bacterium]|nr:hypothetical protein [Planctomycetota bacterium]MBM4082486.1 hypothetical protein [Planctomycetota bacterium]
MHQIRVRGGVAQDAATRKFRAIVNLDGKIYESPETFETEGEAMAHYERHIRPKLMAMMRAASGQLGIKVLRRKIDEVLGRKKEASDNSN